MPSETQRDRPMVMLQSLCDTHSYQVIVRELQLGERDHWMAAEIAIRLLLLQAMMMDPRIQARTGGDPDAVSLVFAEIGCPGCYEPTALQLATEVVKRGGIDHGFDVAKGQARDDFWPRAWQPATPAPESPGTVVG